MDPVLLQAHRMSSSYQVPSVFDTLYGYFLSLALHIRTARIPVHQLLGIFELYPRPPCLVTV